MCIRDSTNESIRKKGKRIEMTVKDKQNGTIRTLLITPQKSGNCIIKTDQTNELSYTRHKAAISKIEPDNGFQQFFRKDTACLQGYIAVSYTHLDVYKRQAIKCRIRTIIGLKLTERQRLEQNRLHCRLSRTMYCDKKRSPSGQLRIHIYNCLLYTS